MTRAAFQEHVDDVFDLGGEMGRPRIARLWRGAVAGLSTVGQDGRQGQAAESGAGARQPVAAIELAVAMEG